MDLGVILGSPSSSPKGLMVGFTLPPGTRHYVQQNVHVALHASLLTAFPYRLQGLEWLATALALCLPHCCTNVCHACTLIVYHRLLFNLGQMAPDSISEHTDFRGSMPPEPPRLACFVHL